MPRRCACDRPGCALCRLYHTRPDYRAYWDGTAPPAAAPARRPLDCIHLGRALPRQPGCGCGQKLRDCAEFGTCSYAPRPDTPHHCTDGRGAVSCPSYEPKEMP